MRQYAAGLRCLRQHVVDVLFITRIKASVALLISSGFQVTLLNKSS